MIRAQVAVTEYSTDASDLCPICGGAPEQGLLPPDPFRGMPGGFMYARCARCAHEWLVAVDPSARPALRPAEDVPAQRPMRFVSRIVSFLAEWLTRSVDKNVALRSQLFRAEKVRLRVLDVGGGQGIRAMMMAKLGHLVTVIDADRADLELAAARGLPTVHGTADALPFPDGSFDRVYMDNVLEHVQDPLIVIAEARRVLKHGGDLIIFVPLVVDRDVMARPNISRWAPHHRHVFSAKSLLAVLASAGLNPRNVQVAWPPALAWLQLKRRWSRQSHSQLSGLELLVGVAVVVLRPTFVRVRCRELAVIAQSGRSD